MVTALDVVVSLPAETDMIIYDLFQERAAAKFEIKRPKQVEKGEVIGFVGGSLKTRAKNVLCPISGTARRARQESPISGQSIVIRTEPAQLDKDTLASFAFSEVLAEAEELARQREAGLNVKGYVCCGGALLVALGLTETGLRGMGLVLLSIAAVLLFVAWRANRDARKVIEKFNRNADLLMANSIELRVVDLRKEMEEKLRSDQRFMDALEVFSLPLDEWTIEQAAFRHRHLSSLTRAGVVERIEVQVDEALEVLETVKKKYPLLC